MRHSFLAHIFVHVRVALKTQWEWRHFKLTAHICEGKSGRMKIPTTYRSVLWIFTFFRGNSLCHKNVTRLYLNVTFFTENACQFAIQYQETSYYNFQIKIFTNMQSFSALKTFWAPLNFALILIIWKSFN